MFHPLQSSHIYKMPSTTIPVSTPVVVITGASRGIGLQFAKDLLAGTHKASTAVVPDNAVIVATARDPANAKELSGLQTKYGARLDIQKLDVSDEKSNDAFADYVAKKYGRVDVLILNAGITGTETTDTLKRDLALSIFTTNTIAPAEQTRAFLPLLKSTAALKTANGTKVDNANPAARVVYISSLLGSVESSNKFFGGAMPSYRASKAALNLYVRSFAADHTDVAFLVLHPGHVATDMGRSSGAPTSVEDSVAGQLLRIAELKLDESAKQLVSFDGAVLPW